MFFLKNSLDLFIVILSLLVVVLAENSLDPLLDHSGKINMEFVVLGQHCDLAPVLLADVLSLQELVMLVRNLIFLELKSCPSFKGITRLL